MTYSVTAVDLLTCSQGALLGGGFPLRVGGVDEGMTYGADSYAVLLHFSPQAVKEGLRSMLGCGI